MPRRLLADFFGFEPGLRNGANLAAGELDGDGRADLAFGLAPAAALEGFPSDVPLRGFDPDGHLIENALRSLDL